MALTGQTEDHFHFSPISANWYFPIVLNSMSYLRHSALVKVLPVRCLYYRTYFFIRCLSSLSLFFHNLILLKSCWHCDFNLQIFFSRTDFSCIISVEVLPCFQILGDVPAGKSGMSVSVLWELCAYTSFRTPNWFSWFASALPDLKYYFSFPVLLYKDTC